MSLVIEPMSPTDSEAIRAIDREGIATGHATFEINAPDSETWGQCHRSDCRLVARFGDQVIGCSALSPVSTRLVSTVLGEISLYLSDSAQGRSIDTAPPSL